MELLTLARQQEHHNILGKKNYGKEKSRLRISISLENYHAYLRLPGINKGSLEELLKDYLSYARQNGLKVWDKEEVVRKVRELGKVWEILKATPTLPNFPNFPNLPNNPTQAVNLMITLTNQAIYLQRRLEQSLEEKHTKEGGFNENLLKKRLEYRNRKI